ncbi:MAG: nucleotidyltransferase family protein [Clostridiaceae bacterium]|jgi:predicted nucleotidyltransferase|nr:nucleotidyltransferase family protein [Clostridiaceae bacterium]
MDTCGLIAEYNPLHRGHQRQLSDLRDRIGKDAGIVICMSGPFCQQGVPALLDKGVRAELALRAGADLVLELPQTFATDSAERFAEGAIETLLATGVVRSLAYGTEYPDKIDTIKALGAFFAEESPEFRSKLKEELRTGLSYAEARSNAAARWIEDADTLLQSPNTILSIEYEKAFMRLLKDDIVLPTYALPLFNKEEWSSRNVRAIVEQRFDRECGLLLPENYWPLLNELLPILPSPSTAAVMRAAIEGRGLVTTYALARHTLLSPLLRDIDQLKTIRGMQGGLAERVVNVLADTTFDHVITSRYEKAPSELTSAQIIATRVFPTSRVRRALLSVALNIRSDDVALTEAKPHYIRVLGFTKRGQRLLSFMRHTSELPVITIASQFKNLVSDEAKRQAQLDLFAQSLWNALAGLSCNGEIQRIPISV